MALDPDLGMAIKRAEQAFIDIGALASYFLKNDPCDEDYALPICEDETVMLNDQRIFNGLRKRYAAVLNQRGQVEVLAAINVIRDEASLMVRELEELL